MSNQSSVPPREPTAILSNFWYAFAKQGATIILPAIGTLYFMIAGTWGLPYGEQVVGTVAALNLFVGVLVGVAKKIYEGTGGGDDGTIVVTVGDDGKKKFDLKLNQDPDELDQKDKIVFKVEK